MDEQEVLELGRVAQYWGAIPEVRAQVEAALGFAQRIGVEVTSAQMCGILLAARRAEVKQPRNGTGTSYEDRLRKSGHLA